jgi:hypothetical protein
MTYVMFSTVFHPLVHRNPLQLQTIIMDVRMGDGRGQGEGREDRYKLP